MYQTDEKKEESSFVFVVNKSRYTIGIGLKLVCMSECPL